MTSDDINRPVEAPRPGEFASTHWSIVLSAGRKSSPDSASALETLCQTYWYPLYAYARRRGGDANDAEDMTQAFLARVLEKDFLRSADPQRGRFRAFLLTMFKRFLASEHERACAQKRGGGATLLSLDFQLGEDRYRNEPTDDWTPEMLYERRWALTLLDRVMVRLKDSYHDRGEEKLFQKCHVHLTGDSQAPPYAVAAEELEMSEAAFRVAVHRARQRYRALLSTEVAQTLEQPDEIDAELAYLRSAIRGQ